MTVWKNFLQPEQRFYVACLVLALFGCGLRFADLNRVGFVVHDARVYDLEARHVLEEGPQRYFLVGDVLAKGQSRVGFYYSYSLALLPYLFEGVARPIFIGAVQLLTYALFCFLLAHYLGAPVALMIFLTLVCFVPHPGQHYAVTSDPITFHVPIAALCLGYGLHLAAQKRQLTPGRKRTVQAITFLCVLAGVSVYEPFYVAFAALEGLTIYMLLRAARQSGEARPARRILTAELPVLAALTSYMVAYVVYRSLYPPAYSGTQLGSGSFQFIAFVKAVYIYTVSGLPGENLWYGLSPQLIQQFPGGWTGNLRRQFGWEHLVLGTGVVAVFWTYIRYAQQLHQNENVAGWSWLPTFQSMNSRRRVALWAALLGLTIAFAVQVPLGMVPRYRDNPLQLAPHASSFLSFICFSVVSPALVVFAAPWLRKWRVLGILVITCTALLAVVTRTASNLVLAQQEKAYAGSKLVNTFMKGKLFASIPEGTVLVAPNLWDDIAPSWDHYEPYWTDYVQLHSGRHLKVVRTMPDAAQLPHEPGRMYYLEKQGSPTAGEPVLVLTDLFVTNNGPTDSRSRSIAVISERPLNGMGLVFQQASEVLGDSGVITIGIPQAAALHQQFDGGSFLASLDIPDTFLPGTAYVVDESAATSKDKLAALGREPYSPMQTGTTLEVRFLKGFAGIESSGAHTWHWSDGASGQGTMAVVNRLTRPVVGDFEACITTGYPERSKLELEFHGKKESIADNENPCPLRRRWTFAPGMNEILIHSYARRVNAPNDPRFIVFGVYDWKLKPVLQ